MEDPDNKADTTSERESQSFKRNYAGTFVAKLPEQSSTEHEVCAHDEGAAFPAELADLVTWIRRFLNWLGANHNAVTATFTVGIFLVTAIYAGVALMQWTEMKKQSGAARDALETERQTLIASERPWLDVNVVPDDLTFDSSGGHLTVAFVLDNAGHSPAQNVEVQSAAFSESSKHNPWFEQNDLCHQWNGPSTSLTNTPSAFARATVFPGHTTRVASKPTIKPEDVEATWQTYPFLKPKGIVHAFVVGCVYYQSDLDPRRQYQTGFIRSLGLVRTTGRTPKSELHALQNYPDFIGHYAF